MQHTNLQFQHSWALSQHHLDKVSVVDGVAAAVSHLWDHLLHLQVGLGHTKLLHHPLQTHHVCMSNTKQTLTHTIWQYWMKVKWKIKAARFPIKLVKCFGLENCFIFSDTPLIINKRNVYIIHFNTCWLFQYQSTQFSQPIKKNCIDSKLMLVTISHFH